MSEWVSGKYVPDIGGHVALWSDTGKQQGKEKRQ